MLKVTSLFVMAAIGGCAVDGGEPIDEVATGETEQAATQVDVWHGTWNGANASVSFYSGTGGGYLDVFEQNTRDYRYTNINLSAWSYDPASLRCETYDYGWWGSWEYCFYARSTYTYGWGALSQGAFNTTGKQARLNTTLGTTVYGYQCTWDYDNWMSSGCTTLDGGTIDLRWNGNGLSSQFNSGTQQASFGAYTFKTQGTYRSSAAGVSGTMLGQTVEGAMGWFGDSRGVNVSKSVFKTPSN